MSDRSLDGFLATQWVRLGIAPDRWIEVDRGTIRPVDRASPGRTLGPASGRGVRTGGGSRSLVRNGYPFGEVPFAHPLGGRILRCALARRLHVRRVAPIRIVSPEHPRTLGTEPRNAPRRTARAAGIGMLLLLRTGLRRVSRSSLTGIVCPALVTYIALDPSILDVLEQSRIGAGHLPALLALAVGLLSMVPRCNWHQPRLQIRTAVAVVCLGGLALALLCLLRTGRIPSRGPRRPRCVGEFSSKPLDSLKTARKDGPPPRTGESAPIASVWACQCLNGRSPLAWWLQNARWQVWGPIGCGRLMTAKACS